MTQENILGLMVAHHALLETLFVVFRDEVSENSPRVGSALSEFSWEMKKHFFAEENAIFNLVPPKDIESWKAINRLKEEHIAMLVGLEKFMGNLVEIKSEEVEVFYNLLKGHREVEEKDLYPRLDKELGAEEKNQIIARINEIPLNLKKI